MADVRNLLRNERASRRISHPHASYTKSGQLLCTVCQLFIKSESLWDGHLRSPNHKKNVQKVQNGGATLEPVSKKRKLDDEEEDTRKKSRGDYEVENKEVEVKGSTLAEASPDAEADAAAPEIPNSLIDGQSLSEEAQKKAEPAQPIPPSAPLETPINEDEWAAFEREVIPLTQDPTPTSNQYGSATISAAPMSAAEVAAQQHESKRPRREEEIEDEQEDEGRRMEEEFEVMEEMEERVKKLKERREALRSTLEHDTDITGANAEVATELAEDSDKQGVGMQAEMDQASELGSEDDDSDFDDWALR